MNAFFFFFQRSCHRCVYRTAGSSINIYYGGATNRYPVLWDIFFSSMQFAKNNKQQGLSDRKNCVSKHSKWISFMAVRVTHIAAIRMTLSDLLNPQNQAQKSHQNRQRSLVYVYFTAKNNKMEGFFQQFQIKILRPLISEQKCDHLIAWAMRIFLPTAFRCIYCWFARRFFHVIFKWLSGFYYFFMDLSDFIRTKVT